MADLATLQVALELQSAQFAQGMDDVQRQINSLNKKVKETTDTFAGFGKTLLAGLTVDAIVSAFGAIIDGMDEMQKASQKIGVSVESLSALKFAAEASGVSFDQLQTGLKKLSQNMQDVAAGTTQAAKALKALGVSGADSAETALAKIADGFASVPDSAKKTALAIELFGKAGAELIPLLNEGADGIDELKKRAAELGIVLDGSTTKQAEAFGDAMDEIFLAGKGIVTQITIGMLPAFQQMARTFADSAKAGTEWRTIGNAIGNTLKFIVSAGIGVVAVFEALGTAIGGFSAALDAAKAGNFAGAFGVINDTIEDTNKVLLDAGASINKIWEDVTPPPEVAENQEKVTENANKMNKAFNALGGEVKKTKEHVEKLAIEFTPLQKAMDELQAATEKRIAAGGIVAELTNPETQRILQELGVSIDDITAAIERYNAVADPAGEKVRNYNKELEKQARALEVANDPVLQYQKRIAELNELQEKAGLSAAAYEAEVVKAGDALNKAFPEDATDNVDAFNVALGNLVSSGVDALTDALTGNAKSFEDWAASVIKSIAQVLLKLALLQIAKQAASAYGVSLGGLSASSVAATSATAFTDATTAGVGAFAMPAANDSAVATTIPVSRPNGGWGGVAAPVNVQVNNYAGESTKVDVATNQQPDGTQQIMIAVRREIKAAMSDGSMDGTMRGNYGVNRRAVA